MKNRDIKRILSIGVGFLLLFDGLYKIMYGVESFIAQLEGYKIPFAENIAYGLVISGEIIAPILLIFSNFLRIAGVLIVINMTSNIYIIHIDHLLEITDYGTWRFETPILYLITGLLFIAWEDNDCLI